MWHEVSDAGGQSRILLDHIFRDTGSSWLGLKFDEQMTLAPLIYKCMRFIFKILISHVEAPRTVHFGDRDYAKHGVSANLGNVYAYSEAN